jgi:hypothetical protein
MRANVLKGKYDLVPKQQAILNATLNTEMAASSYRCAAYLHAAKFFMGSLFQKPIKRRGFYRRILNAVTKDVLSKRPATARAYVGDITKDGDFVQSAQHHDHTLGGPEPSSTVALVR